MKKIYSVAFALLLATISIAAPKNTAIVANGFWTSISTWSLNRVPANGDTVIIPTGKTVVINNNQNSGSSFLYLKVYGTLKLSGGKLTINNSSTVVVYSGGKLTASGSSSELLTIGNVEKFRGDDANIQGPRKADQNTGSSNQNFQGQGSNGNNTDGFASFIDVSLPVRFISFNVARQDNNILVEWATAEESNSSYYEIERSENGIDWKGIGVVKAAGNSNATNKYSFTDKNIISKIVYYRIKQVDADGKFVETPIRMIKMQGGTATIKVYAASSNSIYVHFSEQVKANVSIRVASMSGQIISQQTINQPVGQVFIPAGSHTSGVYVVTVSDGKELTLSKTIVL